MVSKEELRAFYDTYKAGGEGKHTTKYEQEGRLGAISKLLKLKGEETILDIGCGVGFLTSKYAGWTGGKVVGVDFSPESIKEAKGNSKGNLGFMVMDAELLNFEDGTFDCVVCSEVLEHLQDPLQALREMKRVVKPQGRIVITTPNAWLVNLRERFPSGKREGQLHDQPLSPPQLNRLIEKVGLRIKVRRGTYYMPPKALWTLGGYKLFLSLSKFIERTNLLPYLGVYQVCLLSKRGRICLVRTQSLRRESKAISFRVADFIELIKPSVGRVSVMTTKGIRKGLDNGLEFVGTIPDNKLGFMRLPNELKISSKMCWNILRLPKDIDVVFWRIRLPLLPFPLLLAKIKGKRSVVFFESVQSEVCKGKSRIYKWGLGPIFKLLEITCLHLTDKAVTNVPSLSKDGWAWRYKYKIYPKAIPTRIIPNTLSITVPVNEREPIVGYIGGMDKNKGLVNFLRAIPLVEDWHREVKFFVAGGKVGMPRIENMEWIPHEEIGDYLNKLKLLVIPSKMEGLPSIMLEAMACGTPVLATPVGAITDIIKDGETGFLLDNNSPLEIAAGIERALISPRLEEISIKAERFIRENYSKEVIRDKWNEFFKDLLH